MHKGERFNSVSYLLGAALALVATAMLITSAVRHGDSWKIVSFSVYGATLFLLYLSSTLYHGLRGVAAKRVFQKLDHSFIYVFIAGTYTPFTLITLRGAWGWSLFGIVWGLCLLGVLFDLFARQTAARVGPIVIYMLMGWSVLIAVYPLAQRLPASGIAWLVAGGLCYSVGVIFFSLEARMRHAHQIWHVLVLAGSACHFIALWRYVA